MSSVSEPKIPAYKTDFLQACTSVGALTFGRYTLKSKRISPYFFNAGLFHVAKNLRIISSAFAQTLADSSVDFDVLFGPAYKGIPLATATVDKLPLIDEKRFGHVSYSFNRKVVKSYGDGGSIVGAPLKDKRVMIIDDVMTAGTAAREAIEIIQKEGGKVVGMVIALDRMEKTPTTTDDDGLPGPSTVGSIRKEYGIPVTAILTLNDIITGYESIGTAEEIKALQEYRAKYKAND